MVSVPVDEEITPCEEAPVPAVIFPTIVAEAVPFKLTTAKAADPATTFAVSVTPFESVNDPPAVPP